MAKFGIQWLLPVELVGDLPTLAFSAPFDGAEFIVTLDLVRGTMFPLFLVNGMFGKDISIGWFGDGRSCRRDI